MSISTITAGSITISIGTEFIACGNLDCPAISPTSNVTSLVEELDNLKTCRDRLARRRKFAQMAKVIKLRNAALIELRHLIEHYRNNSTEFACTHRETP